MLLLNEERLQAELHDAIKNNEFILYYQPQFNLATSTFDGVEALIRWQHPIQGLLLPEQFIMIAERSDLIITIGEWVLRSACSQFKSWQDKGLSPLRVAVNVSDRQLKHSDFAELVVKTLSEVKLHPNCLELELSENIIINDEKIIEMVQRLKDIGVLVALDDFGTVHSETHHLKKIPVNRIKLDKTQIQNIAHNEHDAAAVKSLIALASSLNLQVVAEGVETFIQLQLLLSHECKEIQGYYFSEPLPAEKVEVFLMANQR